MNQTSSLQIWANKIGEVHQRITKENNLILDTNMKESFDRLLEIERDMKANNAMPFDNGMYCLCANKAVLTELLPPQWAEWLIKKNEFSDVDNQSIAEAKEMLLQSQENVSFVAFVGNLMIFTKD